MARDDDEVGVCARSTAQLVKSLQTSLAVVNVRCCGSKPMFESSRPLVHNNHASLQGHLAFFHQSLSASPSSVHSSHLYACTSEQCAVSSIWCVFFHLALSNYLPPSIYLLQSAQSSSNLPSPCFLADCTASGRCLVAPQSHKRSSPCTFATAGQVPWIPLPNSTRTP